MASCALGILIRIHLLWSSVSCEVSVTVSLCLFLSRLLGCRVTSSPCGISVLTSPLSIISEICLPLHNAQGASVSSPLTLTCLHTKELRPVHGVMICRMVTKGQGRAFNPGFGLLAQLAVLPCFRWPSMCFLCSQLAF